MAAQEKNLRKNRGRPATGRGDQVNVMLRPETSAALDAYAISKNDALTRPQAIRSILVDWLASHGFMKRNASDHSRPIGPATEAVEAMDKAIEGDRQKPRRPPKAG